MRNKCKFKFNSVLGFETANEENLPMSRHLFNQLIHTMWSTKNLQRLIERDQYGSASASVSIGNPLLIMVVRCLSSTAGGVLKTSEE